MQESPVPDCTWNCVKCQHWLRGSTWSAAGVSCVWSMSTHLQYFIPRTQRLWYLSHRCFFSCVSPRVLGSWLLIVSRPSVTWSLLVCTIRFFFFFNLQLYLRHVSSLWLFTEFPVFWFCDLTFLLLAAPADTALSAAFSGGSFSSQVIDKILESGAKNWCLWEPTENVWHDQLIFVSHLEISDFLVTLNEACWLHLTLALFCMAPSQLPYASRGIKLVILFQKEIKFGKLDYQLLWNYKHKLDFSFFWKFLDS